MIEYYKMLLNCFFFAIICLAWLFSNLPAYIFFVVDFLPACIMTQLSFDEFFLSVVHGVFVVNFTKVTIL